MALTYVPHYACLVAQDVQMMNMETGGAVTWDLVLDNPFDSDQRLGI